MEITNRNFLQELDNIAKDLKKSCFIGFDAEFTAILAGEQFKYRLFDTNEERYYKINSEVSKMIMTQVGLTMFQYVRDHDSYVATGYTFHLCPQAIGEIDQSFIFQASTLKFLCKHNFNFNKFIYEGIAYLSKAEEKKVRQMLKENSTSNYLLNYLTIEEEKILQRCCSEVSRWLTDNEEGTMYLDVENPILRYLVHGEVRSRFPGVLTTDSLGNSNKILIYKDKYVEGANSAPMAILEENLMNHLLGFSHVLSLLAQYRKPIIGHNLFLDTVLLHNQFIGPLPKKYSTFKKNINEIFPIIFDTKYISHEMRIKLTLDEVWKSNTLQDLYEFFSERKCKRLLNGVNLIKLKTPFNVNQSYHEAGWDSYCSAYCFIRLAHWAACENSGSYRPVGPTEKLAAMAPFCNRINIIRGAVPYMNLVGEDPPKSRPNLLHVKSLNGHVINISKVASVLSSFGSIDVKPYGKQTALIATGSFHTMNNILKQFKTSNEYRISKYSVYKHSVAGRMAMLGGALLTGSLVLYFLHKNVNSNYLNN